MRLIFLDIDGVLNCQLFFTARDLQKGGSYVENNICKERIGWLNELCSETDAKVVISSTWRLGRKLLELQDLFKEVGATFEIVGYTPNLRSEACVRGNEILKYIKDNQETLGYYSDYNDYVILDDDSDMLLWQKDNFFQTDTYSGLTPNICHRIKRFFERK